MWRPLRIDHSPMNEINVISPYKYHSCVEQRICPFRVAGVANDLSFELDPIGETWPGLVVVTNMEWSYRKLADLVSCVPDPLPMRNEKNAVVYYLFFASPKPVAERIIKAIFTKYR